MRNAAVSPALAACTKAKEPPALGLPGGGGRTAGHRGLGAGQRHDSARHDGRGEVEGLGRNSQGPGRDRRRSSRRDDANGADRSAGFPRTTWTRRKRIWKWHRRELANATAQKDRSDALLKSQVDHRDRVRSGGPRLRHRQGRGGNGAGGAAERANHRSITPMCGRRSPAPSSRRTSSAARSSPPPPTTWAGHGAAQDGRSQPGAGFAPWWMRPTSGRSSPG